MKNHGAPDVAFNGGCVKIAPKGTKIRFVLPHFVPPRFPLTLKHGESMTVLMELSTLEEALRQQYGKFNWMKIRAEVTDQLERLHTSKWTWYQLPRK